MKTRAQRKHIGAIFTPPEIADFMAYFIMDNIQNSGNNTQNSGKNTQNTHSILDPTCGEGFLLDAIQRTTHSITQDTADEATQKHSIECHGIEQDPEYFKISKSKHSKTINTDLLKTEFKDLPQEIQKNSGYDYIIANPPYFNVRNFEQKQRDEYKKRFTSYDGNGDAANIFIEQALSLLKKGGSMIYITQRYFLETQNPNMRNLLREHTIHDIIDFKQEMIFADANVESCIIHLTKTPPQASHKVRIHDAATYFTQLKEKGKAEIQVKEVPQSDLTDDRWIFGESNPLIEQAAQATISIAQFEESITTQAAKQTAQILNEENKNIEKNAHILLGDICELGVGYLTSADKAYEVTQEEIHKLKIEQGAIKKVIKNKDIQAGMVAPLQSVWICPRETSQGIEQSSKKQPFHKQHPNAIKKLNENKKLLSTRPFSFKNKQWYDYKGYQNPHITESHNKIVFKSFGYKPAFALCTEKNTIYSNNVNGLIIKDTFQKHIDIKKLEQHLNSEEAFEYMKAKLIKAKKSGYDFKPNALRQLPIPLKKIIHQK